MRLRKEYLAIGAWLLFIVALGAGWASAAQDDGKVLGEQAKEYWEARAKSDWVTLYKYVPDDLKPEMTQERFVKLKGKNPFQYVSWEIGDVAAEGEYGWVHVNQTVKMVRFPEHPPKKVELWQIWRKGKENWYPLVGDQDASVPKLPSHMRPIEEEAKLTQRVDEFWQAVKGQNWDRVYDYISQDYKNQVSAEEFLEKKSRYDYLSHRVDWAEVRGDRGRVKITFTYKMNDPSMSKIPSGQASTIETWVKTDDKWYRQAKEPNDKD